MFRRGVREIKPVLRQLMTPAAFTAYAFALWRLGADMEWAGDFFIGKGLFSRWQVWLAVAIGTQVAASKIDKADRSATGNRPTAGA